MQGTWLAAFVLQWLILVILVIVTLGILRYLGSMQERIELAAPHISRFEIGDKVSSFELPDMRGTMVNLATVIGRKKGTLVLLVNPGCPACNSVLMQLEELANRGKQFFSDLGWSAVVVCSGEERAVHAMIDEYPQLRDSEVFLLVDSDSSVARLCGARHMPTGLAVDVEGRLVSQSYNPHANWIYKVLDTLPPPAPLVYGDKWEPITVAPTFSELSTN